MVRKRFVVSVFFFFVVSLTPARFVSLKNYIVILKSLGYREKYSGFSKLGEASRLNFRTQALAQHNRILDKVDGYYFLHLHYSFSSQELIVI